MRSFQCGIKAFTIGLFVCIFAATAFAADLTVPGTSPTIQGAIDASVNGDTVTVSPGTYIENINFGGKDIILTSTDPNNPAATTIDGNAAGSVVTFDGTETSACVLRGFTITNGYAPESGGGVCGNSTGATISECIVRNNTAVAQGGGLAFCKGSIVNCLFRNNAANFGGGLRLYRPYVVKNCTIIGNTALIGGGLYSTGPPPAASITNCIIWGNVASEAEDQLYRGITMPTYSCIQDWTDGGTGNITSDPQFLDGFSTDPNEWDLRLLPNSPCIDAGTNTPPSGLPVTDIIGTARPIDGDSDGNPIADIGAYEFPKGQSFSVMPQLFAFSVLEGGSDPVDQSFTVQNVGNQTLDWTIVDVNEVAFSPPGWLTISPSSGTLAPNESVAVTVSVDITELSGMEYSYVFEVVDPALQNSPQTVTVELEVIGPILEVSDTSFSATVLESGVSPDLETIIISNSGGGTINWQIVDHNDITYLPPSWLTIGPVSGTLDPNESVAVAVSMDIAGVSGGQYSYAFDVTDPSAQNSPQTVTIELEVIGPILEVSDTSFSATVYEADVNPDPETLMISNLGGGLLNWEIDTTDQPSWLTIVPTSGSLGNNESVAVAVSMDISGVTGGQYSYAFDVTDPSAQNSPQTVTVELEVIGPILEVSDTFYSAVLPESGINPDSETLNISNSGGGTVNWQIVDYNDAMFSPPAWLTVTPTSGSLGYGESDDVTISMDTTDLSDGGYSYSFKVIDPAVSGSPKVITIALGIGAIYVPGMYPTIQAAINASVNGDTIIVSPGTYIENINFIGKNIILTSIDPNDPDIVESTVIDGNAAGSVVTFDGTETSACQLRGFTITNGIGTLVNSVFRYGGGIYGGDYPNLTLATITHCTITGNTATSVTSGYGNGGGLAFCAGPITNCTITGNMANDFGGGLEWCNGPITHCTITGNTAGQPSIPQGGTGGGLDYCNGPISNCTISGNTADGGGGLSWCNGAISNCTITDNTADSGQSGAGGGLLDCNGPITDCTITGNTATLYGGGLALCDGSITHCTINGNTAGYDGGGLYRCGGPISFCTINRNTADDYGGGLYQCDGSISNCLIAENSSLSGGGMYQCDGDVTNSTIVSNTAILQGSGLYQCSFSGVTNCIIWDNDILGWQTPFPNWNDPIIYTYCCYEEFTGTDSYGNMGEDTLFVDPNNGDYHLKSEYGRWNPEHYKKTDIHEDGNVNLIDFGYLAANWQAQGAGLAGDVNDDQVVDANDLVQFCADYLSEYNPGRWEYDDVTSPCIDAGEIDGTGWHNELWPHGGRINMGAYGGTPEASMSANPVGNIADLDHDDAVGILDLELFSEDWLYNQYLLDTDLNLDGRVDIADFADFANQWLWGI